MVRATQSITASLFHSYPHLLATSAKMRRALRPFTTFYRLGNWGQEPAIKDIPRTHAEQASKPQVGSALLISLGLPLKQPCHSTDSLQPQRGWVSFPDQMLIHLLAASKWSPIPGPQQAYKTKIIISTSCPTQGCHKLPENNLLQI